MRLKLTVATIRSRCHPPAPDELTANGNPIRSRTYWDSDEPGLGLVVRPSRNGTSSVNATFVYQRDVDGRARKVTIGRLGAWTVEQARKRAREIRQEMDDVDYTGRDRARRVTLAEALDLHLSRMTAMSCTDRSKGTVLTEVQKYLKDWLGRPLAKISGEECFERHRRHTAKHGPYIANRVMRHLRACYRSACRVYSALPAASPTTAITPNEEKASEKRIDWADLPAWWARVHELANPIRRDLHLFVLFTGLRSTDAKTVRWADVDLDAGTIHRPMPKGGAKRAFTVPVASFVVELLRRRRSENAMLFPDGDEGWVFPSRRKGGCVSHVREVKQQRYVRVEGQKKPTKRTALPGPHALRHTFASAGYEAMLRELDLMILMNHAAPSPRGAVTRGYIHPSMEHLRECVERVAKFLLERKASAGTKHHLGAGPAAG